MELNFSEEMESFCGAKLKVFDSKVDAFSDCFETIVFAFLPLTLLATTSAFYIGRLRIPDLKIKTPLQYLIRSICTLLTLLVTLTDSLVTIFARDAGQGYVTIGLAVETIALVCHFIYLSRLMKVHFLHGSGPWQVSTAWIFTLPHFVAKAEYALATAIAFSSSNVWFKIQSGLAVTACISQLVYFVCLVIPNRRFRTVSVAESEHSFTEERERLLASESSSYYQLSTRSQDDLYMRQCPADSANIFSRLFFIWVQPLMRKGAKRLLTHKDAVYILPLDINTSKLDARFSNNLKEILTEMNLDSSNANERNILLNVMHKSFGCIYYASGILKFIADVLAFAGPLLLNKLVTYIEDKNEAVEHGYYYATGLFLSTLIGSLLSTHFDYQVNKVKLRVKSALITNIYRKTLQAQPSEVSSYTSGQITNLMSTDVDRVVNFFASFHEFWSLPFQVAITLFLLYQQVGIVFLAGLALAVIMIIFNRYLAKKIGQYNAAMMTEKDSRVKFMTEILLGIRVIKYNAWEDFMSEKLGRIRKEELKNLKGIKYFDAGCVYLWATTPVLISLLTFSIYSALGNPLTAAKVFTVIALINMLISPLNAFPWVINGLMEAWISLKRLNQFIRMRNLELEKYYNSPSTIDPDDMDIVVDLENTGFSWGRVQNSDDHHPLGKDQGLTDVSFRVREGQFIGVIGTVGAGKSSLLFALLAEMKKNNGKVYVECLNDGFAVVTQEPWLQHATIRDNILWGKPYNAHHYESVIDACALREDFQIFPDRDLTEVGENGVTLSGGQKARVALARAVYQDKSLYLLDDPLSAVDQHVASHLHDRCIIGELADKTRIVCTHHTKYLRHADAVIVMENGKIKEIGSPSEILQLSSMSEQKKLKGNRSKLSLASNTGEEDVSAQTNPGESTKLMTEEEKAVGTVAFSVYKTYWHAIGSCLAAYIIVFLFLMQGSKVTSDWWLSYWVSNIKSNGTASLFYSQNALNPGSLNSSLSGFHVHFAQPLSLSVTSYTTLLTGSHYDSGLPEDVRWYLMIYGCIAASNSLFTLFRSFLFAYGGIKAAQVLHSALLNGVLQAPVSFFDVTPVGRILNRFSSDTYIVDDSLPFILNIFLAQFVGVIGTIIVTCYGLPWFVIALIPLGIFYFYVQYYYRLTSRELKRLSSISLSPIYAHFTESLSGLTTIRAFRKHDMFRNRNLDLVTANQRCNFSTLAAQEWFSIRLQMIGVAMVTGVAFVAVIMHQKQSVSPGLAGLALSYALSVTSRLSGVITSFTETEKQMVAVERESHYIDNIPKEKKITDVNTGINYEWPEVGTIEFSDVSLRYRNGLPLALDRVSFRIKSGEKIGIVGRTGSGKSSLLMLLFGIAQPCDGAILIDDVNIKQVPLTILRSKLSIIPQDPFLFSSSLKENLVPCAYVSGIHSEDDLWHVLERCNLKDKVLEMGGLDTNVGERGKRLSIGQRQLLCLARALLTDTKIVCLDEATASVDGESDAILQKTMREQFKDRTVLTIAHRIETIIDCDKVIVMEDGHVAEFGYPEALLSDSDSLFYKLARSSGPTNI